MTGEEIIARLEEESEDGLIVSKASVVAPNPQGGLGLVPWMMSSAPDKLTFNNSVEFLIYFALTLTAHYNIFSKLHNSIVCNFWHPLANFWGLHL